MKFGMHLKRALGIMGIVAGLGAAHPATAVEIIGVKVDETACVANQMLTLNGAGSRYKLVFKATNCHFSFVCFL